MAAAKQGDASRALQQQGNLAQLLQTRVTAHSAQQQNLQRHMAEARASTRSVKAQATAMEARVGVLELEVGQLLLRRADQHNAVQNLKQIQFVKRSVLMKQQSPAECMCREKARENEKRKRDRERELEMETATAKLSHLATPPRKTRNHSESPRSKILNNQTRMKRRASVATSEISLLNRQRHWK